MGTVNPVGNNLYRGLLELIDRGPQRPSMITAFDTTRLATKFAGVLHNFDPADYLDRRIKEHKCQRSPYEATAGRGGWGWAFADTAQTCQGATAGTAEQSRRPSTGMRSSAPSRTRPEQTRPKHRTVSVTGERQESEKRGELGEGQTEKRRRGQNNMVRSSEDVRAHLEQRNTRETVQARK